MTARKPRYLRLPSEPPNIRALFLLLPGTYTITFGANKTVAGAGTGSLTPIAYSLAVTLLTDAVTPAAISGSPFRFSLLPGPIDPSSSIISRAGTGETPAGLTSSFVLNTADIFGNPGQYVPGSFYTINGTAVAWAQPGNLSTGAGPRFSVFNNYDGSYGLTLTTPLAGQYNVTVRMSGVVVGSGQTPGLTFTGLAIPPGKRKRSSFTAAGDCIGSAACRAGTASRLIVQARDQFGNPTANDLTSLAANLTSSFQVRSSTASGFVAFSGGDVATVSPVQAGSPGQLIVPFTALKAGILSVSLGFSDGVQIQGSPYSGAVTAGDPFAAKCVASGPGLVGALSCPTPSAGCIAAYVYLTPRDANNNAVLDGSQSASAAAAVCLRFTVAFSNPQGVSGSPVPQLDTTPGRCVLAYIATVAGQQILTVTLDGRPIAGGGVYTVATQQGIGAASAAQSALSGDGINAVVLAGQVCKLTLTLVDANGIRLRTAVRTNVTAAVTSAKGTAASLVFKVADADNGQMVGSFKPVVSGAFTITVLVNGQPLGAYSNGFTTTVASGATDLLATRVEISPATAKSVPGPVVFCITPRDNGSNPQDYLVSSPDAFSVVVTQPDSSVVTLTAALTPANGTNLFVATFAPLQVGAYRAQVMWSNPSRPDLGASPVGGAAAVSTFGVTSGLPDAAQTELHWQAQAGMQGVTLARAGIPAQLRVSLKDTGERAGWKLNEI